MKKKLLAILIVSLLVFTFGCESYVEHDTTYEAVVGTWNLNCIYLNAHPIEFKDEKLTLNSDGSGLMTTLQTDENGVTSEETVAVTASAGTDSDADGTITLTVNGETKEYTFKVDIPAQLLHLYYTEAESGDEYHYIYVNDLVEY